MALSSWELSTWYYRTESESRGALPGCVSNCSSRITPIDTNFSDVMRDSGDLRRALIPWERPQEAACVRGPVGPRVTSEKSVLIRVIRDEAFVSLSLFE